MTMDGLVDAIIGLDNLAEASGMSSGDVAFGLLLGALGIADRNVSGGSKREDFLKIAGIVYDRNRASLGAGVRA